MGAFYGSVQVRSNQREAVLSAAEATAREKGVKCLIGPVANGWVGVYPEGNGQDESVGAALASRHGGWVLHLMVHDSDVMAYWLWNNGELVDSYWSCPGYFGEETQIEQEKMSGRPEAFEPLIGDKANQLAEILRRDSDDVAFEEERLDRFAKLLDIADAAEAYEYLKEGGAGRRKQRRPFTEVPASAAVLEKKKRDDTRKRANDERRALEKSGLLLLRDERKEPFPYGCAVFNGFVVAWPDHRRGTASIDLHRSPWREATPSRWECPAHITGVASDAAGRRVAVAAGDRVRIWDWFENDWRVTADVLESDLVIGVAISADGKRIAHSSRQEIVVTEIDGRTPPLKVSGQQSQNLAFHPSEDWVAVSGNTFGLISFQDEPRWRGLLIGGPDQTQALANVFLRSRMKEIDPDELKQKRQAAMNKAMAKLRKMVELSGKKKTEEQKAEEFAQMRRQMEQMQQEWWARFDALKDGREPPEPPRAKERVHYVGFSRDGKWLWCGTNEGLRVFRWDSLPRDSGAAVTEPAWRFDLPESEIAGRSYGVNHVHAIAEEADAAAIVFGVGDGRLRRLDLQSGEVQQLVKMPGESWILKLEMSDDGETLGVASREISLEGRRQKDDRQLWDIWSYPSLRRSAGIDEARSS